MPDAGTKWGEKNAARPGSYHGDADRGAAVRGNASGPQISIRDRRGESDAALQSHRRTACVEAATQPRDGCAAGMRNWPGCTHSDPGSPYSLRWCPDFRDGIGGATARPLDRLTHREGACPSGATIGRARLNPSGQTPGRLFGERRLDPMQPVPDSETGTLQVSRHETLEKARNCVNYRPVGRANGRLRKGFRASPT